MTGPTRTDGAMRPGPTGSKPPRPPNAWILYRIDKLRELAERRDPTAPKRLQPEISKEISELWKAEDPEVKREYERIADIKKQEHQMQYPNYKFQPIKKEDRVRQREEEKAEKARVKEELRKARGLQVPNLQNFSLASSSRRIAPYIPPTIYRYVAMGPPPPPPAPSLPMCTPSPEFMPSPGWKTPKYRPAQFPGQEDELSPLEDEPIRPKQQPDDDPRVPSPPLPTKGQQQQQQPFPPSPPSPPPQQAPTPLTHGRTSPPSASTSKTIDLPMDDTSSESSSDSMDDPPTAASLARNHSFRAQLKSEDVSMDNANETGPSSMDMELSLMDVSGMDGMSHSNSVGGMNAYNLLEIMLRGMEMLHIEVHSAICSRLVGRSYPVADGLQYCHVLRLVEREQQMVVYGPFRLEVSHATPSLPNIPHHPLPQRGDHVVEPIHVSHLDERRREPLEADLDLLRRRRYVLVPCGRLHTEWPRELPGCFPQRALECVHEIIMYVPPRRGSRPRMERPHVRPRAKKHQVVPRHLRRAGKLLRQAGMQILDVLGEVPREGKGEIRACAVANNDDVFHCEADDAKEIVQSRKRVEQRRGERVPLRLRHRAGREVRQAVLHREHAPDTGDIRQEPALVLSHEPLRVRRSLDVAAAVQEEDDALAGRRRRVHVGASGGGL